MATQAVRLYVIDDHAPEAEPLPEALEAARMSDPGPRILTKQQHDSVAFDEADRDKEVRQLIGFALDIAKRHLPGLAVGTFADQRNFAGIRRMAVANIGGDIVSLRNVPAERHIKLLVGRQSFHDRHRGR